MNAAGSSAVLADRKSTLAECLVGRSLQGMKSKKIWTVEERLWVEEEKSNAKCSVGYRVRSADGRQAFLKASDLSLLTIEEGSYVDRIFAATLSHKFERELLEYCRGSRMDRVVLAIDYGETMLPFDGRDEFLFFIIFELADHDMRVRTDKARDFSLAWCLSAMHELAVGVKQLHLGNVTHNDIKPANCLVFEKIFHKIADLGCATRAHEQSLYEDSHDAGDPKYAAPEIIYAANEGEKAALCRFDERRAADLYNLGSMIYFLMTGTMMTPQVLSRLAREHRPPLHSGGWNGSYKDVEPYWREAFARLMTDFSERLNSVVPEHLADLRHQLFKVVSELCEPQPELRGHPLSRSSTQNRYSVERYISMFDSMRRKAELKIDG
ncbi:serine/threonine protein kinase [Sphingobium sp. B7D2B]|uniref:protein kinase domain-containing protein n=1 Tax=Sphingobium sp. B7D2B TaxID=2940583 RepID=UPI002225AFA8|nr:protein kinase [Sphingobium sp. B7D2B]MCW2366576.1 serine/threonine protein kinase [Sphingobium sp. B7D2B]